MTMTDIWRMLVRVESPGTRTDPASATIRRTFVVPPDIIPVKRRSPVRVRKTTRWHPQPDGHPAERCGGRDWFSDRLLIEPELSLSRACRCASAVLHAACVMVILAVLVTRSDQLPRVRVGGSMMMPAMTSPVPMGETTLSTPSVDRAAPKANPAHAAAAAPAAGVRPAAPVEAPTGIQPETGNEMGEDGVGTGVVGGGGGGGRPDGALSSGPPSPGSLRIGGGIQAPRKIKDVKPVYPQGALAEQMRGTVIIEATIGIDGRVEEAVVLHSIPLLDQAAIDAVRQWEYAPSLLNGVPVAVILTIIVNFVIQ